MKRLLETALTTWKNRKDHLPLLLRGARQVGKSTLVKSFGTSNFENIVTVDFERKPELAEVFTVREPKKICEQLEVALQERIIPGKTLLFLDEIQECPNALIGLRYFYEELPSLHVIAAGSLLEFLLNQQEYSFPVGRIEFLYLYPLSFEEFLSQTAPLLLERWSAISLANPPHKTLHDELLKQARLYFFVGGMPKAVTTYLNENSLLEAGRIHSLILTAYGNDFGKYAPLAEIPYLEKIFRKAPALIAETIKYVNIDPEVRSRDLKPALELLTKAGLLQQVFATSASGIPLNAHLKEHRFKLFFLDIGLVQTACEVDGEALLGSDLLQINRGALAEQFVFQELLASSLPYQHRVPLFWEREEGQAEVDFVITVDQAIIPIEVKAGATGSLKSLKTFVDLKRAPLGIRIWSGELSYHAGILSVPLYLVRELPKLVREALKLA